MKFLALCFIILVGWTSTVSAISGGFPARLKNHKHLVQLRYEGYWICGGSLVSKSHVVTSARCVEDKKTKPSLFSIKAGSLRVNGAGKIRQVTKIWIHPRYNWATWDYDVAVLKLAKSIEGTFIKPIPLGTTPLKGDQYATVAGWGVTRDNGFPSSSLRAVYVQIVNQARCTARYPTGLVTNRMICAGLNLKDACDGDTGGAMTHNGKLYGIVSWSSGCVYPDAPGIYTNVLKVKVFINSKIKL